MIVDFPLDVSCYIEVFNPHVGVNRYIIPAKIAGINIIVIPLPPSTLCFVKHCIQFYCKVWTVDQMVKGVHVIEYFIILNKKWRHKMLRELLK